MISKEIVKAYCRDLSPPEVERAIKFNEISRDEAIVAYKMFIEQNKIPRQVFINGYNAMYAASALFLAKKYKTKLDEHQGGAHKNMRDVLNFYTHDSIHNSKLIALYEVAIEKFQVLSQQYNSETYFAKNVVKDLISEGYQKGKKITYYNTVDEGKKDPLELDILDAKRFIEEIVNPFLFIIGELTDA